MEDQIHEARLCDLDKRDDNLLSSQRVRQAPIPFSCEKVGSNMNVQVARDLECGGSFLGGMVLRSMEGVTVL